MATSEEITRALGLPRPFDSYAPRTQRRYRAAFLAGRTAAQENKREYRKRVQSKSERTRRVAAELRRLGVNSDGSHDPDNIDRLGHYLGWEQALNLLTAQRDATKAYRAGNAGPGQQLFFSKNSYEPDNDFDVDEYVDLQPYTRYHGK